MSNQPILCHRPLHVEGKRGKDKGGREGGETGQVGGVGLCPRLPGLCTRCLWRAGLLQPRAEGWPAGASQEGQLVQVVINSGKRARPQACSGHEP